MTEIETLQLKLEKLTRSNAESLKELMVDLDNQETPYPIEVDNILGRMQVLQMEAMNHGMETCLKFGSFYSELKDCFIQRWDCECN